MNADFIEINLICTMVCAGMQHWLAGIVKARNPELWAGQS